ncbi:MAG: DUF2846 domain-containing protein [Bacteroidota bacterium]|nr:DUF2846 domain-containing protein [Bacteroidota bacterium]
MRKILFFTALFIAGIFFSKAAISAPKKPTGDSTFIYVYRVGQFNGAAANWAIFLDGEKKCKLSNNKYMRLPVTPGKHKISAHIGGASLFKKETEIDIDATTGGNYYVACNIKQSITRARLEMLEVTKSTAAKQMEKMSLDNCQENIDQ